MDLGVFVEINGKTHHKPNLTRFTILSVCLFVCPSVTFEQEHISLLSLIKFTTSSVRHHQQREGEGEREGGGGGKEKERG